MPCHNVPSVLLPGIGFCLPLLGSRSVWTALSESSIADQSAEYAETIHAGTVAQTILELKIGADWKPRAS